MGIKAVILASVERQHKCICSHVSALFKYFFSGLYKQALSAFLAVDDKNNQGSIKIFLSSSCNIVFRCVILIFPRVPKNKFEEKMVYCNYECAHV